MHLKPPSYMYSRMKQSQFFAAVVQAVMLKQAKVKLDLIAPKKELT